MSLHHIADWRGALAEMIRVTSHHIIIHEPIDDLRSGPKRRSYEAQGLFLQLQAEVGYPHYLHLDRDTLLSAVEGQAVVLEVQVERSDAPVTFDEFFDSFDVFASRSGREGYWLTQMHALRAQFGDAPLCADDTLTILAEKR